MTLTEVVPPPHPASSRRRVGSKIPKMRAAKEGMTAANSDDVLNGNAPESYEVRVNRLARIKGLLLACMNSFSENKLETPLMGI